MVTINVNRVVTRSEILHEIMNSKKIVGRFKDRERQKIGNLFISLILGMFK